MVQSVEDSNRLEDIATTPERLRGLIEGNVEPQNYDEEQIAGYYEALARVQAQYGDIACMPQAIISLHHDLFRQTATDFGGVWKQRDNIVVVFTAQGEQIIRFRPLATEETPSAMDLLCRAFSDEIAAGMYDPLLLVPLFVFDFMCIHPFADGNGRMSRLLASLLLCRSGYSVGRYVSLEKLMYERKQDYYDALTASSIGWHSEMNDYMPFVTFFLETVIQAYRTFLNSFEER